jgi:ribose transport system permease protein
MTVVDREGTVAVEVREPTAFSRAKRLQTRFPLIQILMLLGLFTWGATTVTDFAGKQSLLAMLVTASFLGIVGAGQTVVVLIGGVDLSAPAFISAGAIVTAQLTSVEGWPFIVALALIVVMAVALGAVNGYVSRRFNVQPLVVTLAMGSIITGGLLVWTNGVTNGTAPPFLNHLTSLAGTTFGIGVPPVIFIWAFVALSVGVVLRSTVVGRRLYATGGNPRAAELALIRTGRVWTGTFAFSALISSLLGVLLVGFTGSGDVNLGDPYLFQGLAAVIVGGTAFGGRGDYWKTVVGALLLTVLSTTLASKGYSAADQEIVFGVLILLVVGGYGRDRPLRDRV